MSSLAALTAAMGLQNAIDGQPAKLVQLTNCNGICATFMDIGATWLSCHIPVDGGREVLLRSPDMAAHMQQTAYFGSIVGRYANRIDKGRFTLGDHQYQTTINDGDNTLHGGVLGFDKKRWQITEQSTNYVEFSLLSCDGDQGYPGNAQISVKYELTDDNEVVIHYQGSCDQDTVMNLTNHAYFNLAGESSGALSLDHRLQMHAHYYLPTREDLIPTGEFRSVQNTSFDFCKEKAIGKDFLADVCQTIAGGYDHAFIFDEQLTDGLQTVVTLSAPSDDLKMTVATTKPAIQFYSGNFLNNTPGASGPYQQYAGLALETQYLPDGPNHPEWQGCSGILEKSERYQHKTVYKFNW